MVKRDGESHEKIKSLIEARESAWVARRALMNKYGGSSCYGNDNSILGLVFEGAVVPEGFKRAPGSVENVYILNKRIKAGKALVKEFGNPDLVVPGAREFHWKFSSSMWMGEHIPGRGFPIAYILFEKFGDEFVLLVPITGRPKNWTAPADCTPMKRSEYWLMKEAKTNQNVTPAALPVVVR